MTGTAGGSAERPALFFEDAAEFRAWLEEHHESATELWMGLRKKHVSPRGLTWEEAVPQALCFGWIDSIAQRIDEDTLRQRWTPRKPTSIWSSVNIALVERLTAEGRMRPAGLAAYERRRADRSGIYAYERGSIDWTEDHEAAIAANPAAAAFWAQTTAGYRKVATHWVVSAKQETTRTRRLAQLVDDSAHGRLIPSQRYGETPAWVARAAAATAAAAAAAAATAAAAAATAAAAADAAAATVAGSEPGS